MFDIKQKKCNEAALLIWTEPWSVYPLGLKFKRQAQRELTI